ncbi:MAG: hypothetical protein ACRC6O_05810, partial [Flavobacterium sp.]
PLSPPAGKQIELKPFKSYDLEGFFFYTPSKIFINACSLGDKIGYPKTQNFWVTEFISKTSKHKAFEPVY